MRMFAVGALFVALACMAGCATVPLATPELSANAKEFAPPQPENAGIYIYRSSFGGQALKKDIWIDGECVGQSVNDVFFYKEVLGDREHVIATESEFSPNEMRLLTKAGRNYFIRQYIRIGLFVGGADLEMIDPEKAKEIITKLNLAVGGDCENPTP